MTRGVYPVLTQRSSNWNDLMEKAIEGAERMKFVKKGDCIVLSAGMPLQVPGTTNLIRVKTIE